MKTFFYGLILLTIVLVSCRNNQNSGKSGTAKSTLFWPAVFRFLTFPWQSRRPKSERSGC